MNGLVGRHVSVTESGAYHTVDGEVVAVEYIGHGWELLILKADGFIRPVKLDVLASAKVIDVPNAASATPAAPDPVWASDVLRAMCASDVLRAIRALPGCPTRGEIAAHFGRPPDDPVIRQLIRDLGALGAIYVLNDPPGSPARYAITPEP